MKKSLGGSSPPPSQKNTENFHICLNCELLFLRQLIYRLSERHPQKKSSYMEIQPCFVVLCFWLSSKACSLFQIVRIEFCLACNRPQYTCKSSPQISQYSCVTTGHKEVKSNHSKRWELDSEMNSEGTDLQAKLNKMRPSNFILIS